MTVSDDVRLGGGLVLLLVICVAVLRVGKVSQQRAAVIAAVRAVAQLAFVAAALKGVFAAPVTTVLAVGVMFGVATWTATRRLRGMRGVDQFVGRAVVIGCGAGATVAIGVICGLPTLDRSTRTLVAVSGIVIGGTMTATTIAGRRLADGLNRRREEVEAWLAIGATHRQAVADIVRSAAGEALVPVLDQTRTVGLVTLPGAFIGALLGGASAVSAAKFQIVVLVGLLCAEAISAVTVTYLLGAPRQLPEAGTV